MTFTTFTLPPPPPEAAGMVVAFNCDPETFDKVSPIDRSDIVAAIESLPEDVRRKAEFLAAQGSDTAPVFTIHVDRVPASRPGQTEWFCLPAVKGHGWLFKTGGESLADCIEKCVDGLVMWCIQEGGKVARGEYVEQAEAGR